MRGERMPDSTMRQVFDEWPVGAYGRAKFQGWSWLGVTPTGARVRLGRVVEHEDGTVSSPHRFVCEAWRDRAAYDGMLKRGEWS